MTFRILSDDEIAALPPDAQAEYLEHLEALYWARGRESLLAYSQMIEVPGAPLDEPEPDTYYPQTLKPASHHRLLVEAIQNVADGTWHDVDGVMALAPPGSAKALALDTPIPTPDGWKLMGELKVGDRVFGDDGRPCNVTWVSPIWKDRPIYRVTTDCGDAIIADRDHEWVVRLCGKSEHRATIETWQLAKKRSKRPMIERAKALELPAADLPIDPYVLGVWLGNGHSQGTTITSHVDDKPWLDEELTRLGCVLGSRSQPGVTSIKGMRETMSRLNLIHDPWTVNSKRYGHKHIPPIYLRASVEQRIALLQGLIDTDGTVCKKRGCTTFCNTNEILAQGVRELVRSLGLKAGWSEGPAMLNGKHCGTAYRVSFYFDRSARLPRKAVLCRNQWRTPNTYVEAVECGTGDTVCIEVDSPSHLFLAGRSMTPTHNSTWLSVIGASWLLGRKPGTNVIGASYGQDLANRFGRRVRTVARSERYERIMGATIVGDNQAVDSWSLSNGSDYRAAGMGAAVTGFRADCLSGDTLIETLDGPRTIADIHDNPVNCKVLSYEGSLRKTAYRRVLAVARRHADELWRIRTASGHVVEATGNHRFHTERGWTEAASLVVGDVLLRVVQGEGTKGSLRGSEEDATVLRGELQDAGTEQSARLQGSAFLQRMREASGRSRAAAGGASVLQGMPSSSVQARGRASSTKGSGEDVRRLWEELQAVNADAGEQVLFKGLQERRPFPTGCGHVEPELARRQDAQSLQRWERPGVQEGASGRYAAGPLLRDMRRREEIAWTSHRRGQHEQRRDERRHSLWTMSHETARGGEREAVADRVAVVERVRHQGYVYDIQVEETACFFANGILVHNCLLIDDPLKGREEADSQVIRDKVWNGLQDDLFTRLKPGGKIVVCLTHWHEDDPAGRLLGEDWKGQSGLWRGTDGRLWHIINLPMLAEHKDDPLGRKHGEMLWPEWYRETEVKRLEAQASKGGTAARTWSSLYQQRPAPADGSILLRSYWKAWKEDKPPECEFVLLAYDTAIEEGEEHDQSAMTAWGVFPHVSRKASGEEYNHNHVILLGAWADWVQAADLADIMEDHYRIMKPDLIIIEKRATGAQLVQELKRKRLPVRPWLPKGPPGAKGKIPRAHAIAMMLEQGSVHYMPGSKTEMVLTQCAMFPHGTRRDLVDTVTMALAFFRDRFMFRTADEEMDDDDLREMIKARHEARKSAILGGGRRLYGGEATGPTRMAQNERRLYGGTAKIDRDEPTIARMTPESRKRHHWGRS